MTHLFKITKKSCLKLLRKIAPHKPLSIRKLEEEDEEDETSADHDDKLSVSDETPISKLQSPINSDPIHSYEYNQTVQVFESPATHQKSSSSKSLSSSEPDSDDKRILQSLTSKLFLTADGYEFRRLQQLCSDTTSEVVQFEPEFKVREIIFEKVKYNKHVRYFRRTPSSLSLDNYASNENIFAAESTQDLRLSKQYSNNNPSTSPPPSPPLHVFLYNDKGSQPQSTRRRSAQIERNSTQRHIMTQHTGIPNYVPLNVMNLELKNAGRFQNVTISEQRDSYDKLMPVVKWDINGNSLDDDFYNDDGWNEFDANWNHMADKRLTHFKLDTDSQKSSFRSSSTTLETWLDEDLFGNSFNERRQLQLSLCRSKV